MSAIRRALHFIHDTFRKDEAQGYRSRDRQFAIEIAERALKAEPSVADNETIDKLMREKAALEAAIRAHRDAQGDDRCWLDDEALYSALPEGFTPPERGELVELELCKRFIACRHNPATAYVSPQRRIEELQAVLREIVGSHGHVRDADGRAPLAVALERWAACVKAAKEALGE